ncbi:hypothetical protein AVEN_230449-1 [Araneus ventricosus]|uniref:CCHC-type domain-containing protein n=1 Tax=Araneus ventricosus TaxID=182803 RepID=A0A4Y2KRZ1_ARAVE|nr:hypothetical protein AVEN_230449-1 [Araneus ventricosus]
MSPTRCYMCNRFGHISTNCPNEETGLNCEQESHKKADCFPARVQLFTSEREKLKSGIAIFDPSLQAIQVYFSNNIVAVLVQVRKKNILIVSCYCPPKEDIAISLRDLENCITIQHDHVLITGDFNSKSPVWGGNIEDESGRQLLESILSKGLAIVNEDSIPTIDGAQGYSWFDITISNPNLHQSIFQWKVDIEPTCSDHNRISFTLYAEKIKIQHTLSFNCKNINISKLRTFLQREIGNRSLPPHADLDQEINSLINSITTA